MPGMTGFWEWLGRVIMLVLAGMITLSIIGAIAAIPSQSIETRFGMEPRNRPQSSPVEEPVPPPAAAPASPAPRETHSVATRVTQLGAQPQPEQASTAADWLEAITYALLALVGLAVVGIVLLWRAAHHWRRCADAVEMLAVRGP